jgi:hypothetical protein
MPSLEGAARPVTWLWPGYLASERLTLLDGDPGLGKSLVALDLAARLATGRGFPEGAAETYLRLVGSADAAH